MIYPAAKVIIFDENRPGEVLLIKREVNNEWGFEPAGGRVEVDFVNGHAENLEAAAIREVFEEVGLEVVLTGYLGSYTFFWTIADNTCSCCAVYLGKVIGGTISTENLDISECKLEAVWVALDDILHNNIPIRETHLGLREVLKKAALYLQTNAVKDDGKALVL